MPWAYALFCYLHLQELDWRRTWRSRIERIHLADMVSMAFHEPDKIGAEYQKAIADAGPRPDLVADVELLAFGRRMIDDLNRGRVLS